MTEDQSRMLSIFEARVRQLMFLCDDLKKENEELKFQFEALSQRYEMVNEENRTLKVKYDNLKTARIISVKQDDFKGAKSRISKLVKEVDKCIALLND
ncbi:putative nuclease with TOPRIM domain [Dysgonomonadaceae bacterium PH5-43]|nr:putative nuclease with TOPRIM domain [Dysgonomonadaceae bacterium PH5-43]